MTFLFLAEVKPPERVSENAPKRLIPPLSKYM
jgi:hypothetical protein